MGKMFYVYATHGEDLDSCAEAFLNLPASPYEMLDALDKLRLGEGESVKFGIEEYYRFDCLEGHLSGKYELLELNALAQKLSELDDRQQTAFEGLLQMASHKKEGPINLPQIINIAYSTDCCHVVDDVLNDSQLGWFCAESGFVPGAEELPDSLFELLDFERIGREHRQREGGVLVERSADHPGGYVEQHSELVEAYKNLDLTLKAPDHIFRVGIVHHPDAVLGADPGKVVYLDLPVSEKHWQETERRLGDPGWLGTVLDSVDGSIPNMENMLCSTEDLPDLNRLARKLMDMEPKEVTAYKALLAAVDCRSLDSAEQLIDTLDNYIFSPQYSSPIEVAKGELSVILAEPEVEMIVPHLNLYRYGEALIKDCGSVLTPYGLIEREDRQPVQAMAEGPKQSGMEMS